MGLTEESRKDIVVYRIERAYTALDQAKKNLEINCLEVTANRLYYAAYYAASALLIAHGIQTKSHEGCIAQFGKHFVITEVFPKEMGKLFNNLFQMRLTGDYSDHFDLTAEEVMDKIKPTEKFVAEITASAMQELGLKST